MTFKEFCEIESITEGQQYFLLYYLKETRDGKQTHAYFIWSVDDIKKFSDYARGSTMKDCVNNLNGFFARKTNVSEDITLLGKVSGIEEPMSTEQIGVCKTKEKALLALKKLCPKAVQVLNKSENSDDTEPANEALSPDKRAERRGKAYMEMNHLGFSIEAVERQIEELGDEGDLGELNKKLQELKKAYNKARERYRRNG